MDDTDDFIQGDLLGNQIHSSQIKDFVNIKNHEKAMEFVRKLDEIDIFAIQRFIQNEIDSICADNKSLFGQFVLLYMSFSLPLLYIWIFETDANFNSLGGVLILLIISIILINGFWHMGKTWKYLSKLAIKNGICNSIINERLIILLNKNI